MDLIGAICLSDMETYDKLAKKLNSKANLTLLIPWVTAITQTLSDPPNNKGSKRNRAAFERKVLETIWLGSPEEADRMIAYLRNLPQPDLLLIKGGKPDEASSILSE